MDDFRSARWYTVRPAANRKPATYRCPLCGELLPALSEHMLVLPEGDATRRRHAHGGCVMEARREGGLPLREEIEPRRRRAPVRASDADRDRAVRALRDHYAAGRLTTEELDERVERACQATFRSEL